MSDNAIIRLRDRRKEIAAKLKELDETATALRTEDSELESTERVLARFVPEAATSQPKEAANGATIDGASSASAGSGKPVGTPTTPQMIITLLKDAERQGKTGLEPREMLIAITKRWWPSVKSEDVAPTAWRMWKDGRLLKDGSLYRVNKDHDAIADLLK